MPSFRMSKSMDSFPMNHDSNTNPSANSHINKRVFDVMIAQFIFSKSARIDVSVNFDFFIVQPLLENVQYFNILPEFFGSSRY